jgi:hypothetical protein
LADANLTRRPLSARTRFEVFKRDEFTCQYCGRKAPDVALHIDHIVAVANGGTDDAMNLLTACSDCNLGKSAVPLDRIITPENPAQRAREIAETEAALREYNRQVLDRDLRAAADRERAYQHFLAVTEWSCMRPDDFNWLMSVAESVPIEVLIQKIDAASFSGRPKRAWIPYVKTCIRRWREEGE